MSSSRKATVTVNGREVHGFARVLAIAAMAIIGGIFLAAGMVVLAFGLAALALCLPVLLVVACLAALAHPFKIARRNQP